MERPSRYSTIIVALDGTRKTEQAVLGPARELAQLYGATLVLVRALDRKNLPAEDAIAPGGAALAAGPPMDNVTGIDIPTIATVPGDGGFRPAQPIDNPDAAGYLNVLDHELEASGLIVEHVDPDDDPADAIVHEARSRGASLIVMGTHQRKGLERLFKGSVAEHVLRESPCAVLAIPLD